MMNKILILCSVLLLGVVGCEKDGGNEPVQPRNVKSIMIYNGNSEPAKVTFQYDANNRIVGYETYANATTNTLFSTMAFDYTQLAAGKLNYTERINDGLKEYRYAATLDANKRVTQVTQTSPTNVNWLQTETITYDAQGYAAKSSNGRSNSITFTWSNGNMTESKGTYYTEYVTYGQPMGPVSIDLNWVFYTVDNLTSSMGGDIAFGSALAAQGFCGKRNAQLVKQLVSRETGTPAGDRSQNTYEFTYTVDDKGCPTEVKVKETTNYDGSTFDRRYVIVYE